jgi:hypothetical protein
MRFITSSPLRGARTNALIGLIKPPAMPVVMTLDVVAKLKKEFHQYNESTHYKYSCKVKLRQDIYRPKVTITKSCIAK